MIKTFEDMIELMHTYWGGDDEVHKDLDRLLELHNTEIEQIRADAIDEFRNRLFGKLARLTLSMWNFKLFDDVLQETYNELKEQK